MMKYKLFLLFIATVALTTLISSYGQSIAATLSPNIILSRQVSQEVGKNEVPRAVISQGLIHAVWRVSNKAQIANAPELSGSWGPAQTIGSPSSGTYHTMAIAENPIDKSLHIAWVDQSAGFSGRVFYSRRSPSGPWSAPVVISGPYNAFSHYPSIAVTTQGVVWINWSRMNGNKTVIQYKYSPDGGATWLPNIEGDVATNNAKRGFLAADNSGGIHITWFSTDDGYRIHYGRWTGAGWTDETLPITGINADSNIAIDKNNNISIMWRRQRGEAAYAIYYAYRPANTTGWAIQNLYEAGDTGRPGGIDVDEANVVHIAWDTPVTGGRIGYGRRLPSGQWLGTAFPINAAGFSANPSIAAIADQSSSRAHVLYQVVLNGDIDTRIYETVIADTTITTGPPVTPTPTTPPVDFTATRTSPSPTKNANVTVNLTGLLGSPNQMRVSLTPFAPTTPESTLPWSGLEGTFTRDVTAGLNGCSATLYIQVRNSTTGQISAVKSVTASVDTGIQATISINAVNYVGQRPAQPNLAQPNAPDIRDPNYIRDASVKVSVSQETAGCAGMAKYQVDKEPFTPATFPDQGFAPVTLTNVGADPGGRGYPEQDVTITTILTDTLGNQQTGGKNVTYDDDPPVLASSGTATFPNGTTTNISVVPVNFSATVTDDGYKGGASNKKYWGVWVLATTSQTAPSLTDFQMYGDVIQLPAGATTIPNVRLVNFPTGTAAGDRYVHIRFLDGAANYSETEIVSEKITLQSPYTGLLTYLPVVLK